MGRSNPVASGLVGPLKPPLTSLVGEPVTYVQGLRLKVSGAVLLRFTNSPITRDQDHVSLRGRTAGSGSTGEAMRVDGTPVRVTAGKSVMLDQERLGGGEGLHDEQWLQQLIHRHPAIIPIGRIETRFSELVSVCMELPLRSGYLNNLLMTSDGNIVIVEVKLFRNPQARREVLAQALDYATALFRMNYTDLEAAVLKSDFDGIAPPARLYDLFDGPEALDESAFVDAVNTNLKNGRIVVLVAGDGIRTDVESLMDGLQAHAGFHFTFALLELAVFQRTSADDLIVMPRILAKTEIIPHFAVQIDDQRVEIVSLKTEPRPSSSATTPQSISSEQFYETVADGNSSLLGQLKAFVDKLSGIGVYPDFKQSLIFRWDTPSGRSQNMGYIAKTGVFYTDHSGGTPAARKYIEDLADCFGGKAKIHEKGNGYVVVDGKPPHIRTLTDKQEAWLAAIENFQSQIRNDEGE